MAERPVFTYCRLAQAIQIALQFNIDRSRSIAGDVSRSQSSYEPPPEDENGEVLDLADTSALDGLTNRLVYLVNHLPAIRDSDDERKELIEILVAVCGEMKRLRCERKRRGLHQISWKVSIAEVDRAIDALREKNFGLCKNEDDGDYRGEANDGFEDEGRISFDYDSEYENGDGI